ncbi:ATP-dependent zinc protease [Alteromonas oceani]|uniref:ATP-dependent zinc protease n=1 Tax=Alteromonas oceani TaxID=2071609 RepID=A0ABV7JZG3_9ALTE|nr:ATP-dependent zinc protease [Alteromonas oceani]MDG6099402.1 ATP-dependent zinc protease [Alteromonas sp. ZYF713]
MSKSSKTKQMIGALEYGSMPELGINNLVMRVDTGAATSSLHVDNIEEFERDNERWIRFDIHPDIHDVARTVRCESKVLSQKKIKSSTADRQRRYVINTRLQMGTRSWKIKLTLTDRSEMTYLMLLGRQAMVGKFYVDPEYEFILPARP